MYAVHLKCDVVPKLKLKMHDDIEVCKTWYLWKNESRSWPFQVVHSGPFLEMLHTEVFRISIRVHMIFFLAFFEYVIPKQIATICIINYEVMLTCLFHCLTHFPDLDLEIFWIPSKDYFTLPFQGLCYRILEPRMPSSNVVGIICPLLWFEQSYLICQNPRVPGSKV